MTSRGVEDLNDALRRARAGDISAFGDLYRGLAAPLLSYLLTQTRRREDAEDLLGEVFTSAIRDLRSFKGDASGFRAWLYRIATNRAIDLARRQLRRPEEPIDAVEHVAAGDPEAEAIGNVERDAVRAAVMALPDEQRRVMVLRIVGGLTATEIAEIVGKRAGAVKALQHRALANLGKALSATNSPYPESGNPYPESG